MSMSITYVKIVSVVVSVLWYTIKSQNIGGNCLYSVMYLEIVYNITWLEINFEFNS